MDFPQQSQVKLFTLSLKFPVFKSFSTKMERLDWIRDVMSGLNLEKIQYNSIIHFIDRRTNVISMEPFPDWYSLRSPTPPFSHCFPAVSVNNKTTEREIHRLLKNSVSQSNAITERQIASKSCMFYSCSLTALKEPINNTFSDLNSGLCEF